MSSRRRARGGSVGTHALPPVFRIGPCMEVWAKGENRWHSAGLRFSMALRFCLAEDPRIQRPRASRVWSYTDEVQGEHAEWFIGKLTKHGLSAEDFLRLRKAADEWFTRAERENHGG